MEDYCKVEYMADRVKITVEYDMKHLLPELLDSLGISYSEQTDPYRTYHAYIMDSNDFNLIRIGCPAGKAFDYGVVCVQGR